MSGETDGDAVSSAYDVLAPGYAAQFRSTEPEQPIDLAMIDHFVGQLGEAPDVLDAGCGTGRMARYLSDRGCQVSGVDLSPGMVRMARRDHPDIPTQVGTITELPFADGSFGGLFFWYSIIHLADAAVPTVFEEARRVLRPGGHLLVAFQTGAGERDVAEGLRRGGYDVSLTRYHRSPDDVATALRSAGFDIRARLVRSPAGDHEREGQAVLVARLETRA